MGVLLTPDIARAYIGHQVMHRIRSGHGTPRLPSKLVAVVDDETVEILPNGHRKIERVPMRDCKLTSKSFKTGAPLELAGVPNSKEPSVRQVAELEELSRTDYLRKFISDPKVRSFMEHLLTPQRIRQLVENGEQPMVRFIIRKSFEDGKVVIFDGKLIGAVDDKAIIVHPPTGETTRADIGMVSMHAEDQPGAKAEAPRQQAPLRLLPPPLPGDAWMRKRDEERRAAEAADAHAAIPDSERVTAGIPDSEPSSRHKGLCIAIPSRRLIWTGTPPVGWGWKEPSAKAFAKAIRYGSQAFAANALRRMGENSQHRAAGIDLSQAEVLPIGRLRYLVDQWCAEAKPKPEAKRQPAADAKPAAPVPPPAAPVAPPAADRPASAPATTPAPGFETWAKLMADEAEAEALLYEVRAQRIRAGVGLEIAARRKAWA